MSIITLVGKSGSGKTYIEKNISENFRYVKIISHTTRPIRDGEVDGADYFYVSQDEFYDLIKNDKMAEFVEYGDNFYGISKKELYKADDLIVIVEPNGLNEILEIDDLNIISFYIDSDLQTRILRMEQRGDSKKSILKRVLLDKKAFENLYTVDYVVDNNSNNVFDAITEIFTQVEKHNR